MKICGNPKCNQVNPQPLIEFSKDRSRQDGFQRMCKKCHKEYEIKNKEKIAIQHAVSYRKNIEERGKKQKAYNDTHKNEKSTTDAARYVKDKSKILAQNSHYKKSNPGIINAIAMKRAAAKIQATPSWLIKEQLLEIQAFYLEAARLNEKTGVKHHVDHIIPLQGGEVSGFHVPWNLQILTAEENSIKSNSFDFTPINGSWRST